MKIKTRVTFKQYVKLLYGLTYQRKIMKVVLGIALLLILWIGCYYLNVLDLPEPRIYQYITLALILVIQPIVIYTTIHRVYYSSNHICEPLEMEILSDEIKIQGKSFYMEVKWEKMFKIVEIPKWFLVYQNSLSAILIPKKNLSSKESKEFREILQKLEKVPVALWKTDH